MMMATISVASSIPQKPPNAPSATYKRGSLLLIHQDEKGTMIFTVLMLLITAFSIFGAFETHRSSNVTNKQEFKFLFAGIILIDDLFATFVVLYFVNHQKIYS